MTLSNIDLEDIARHMKLPIIGVFSKDQLPKRHQAGSYYINMQDHDKGDGTHWVLVRIFDKHDCIYFDSFGVDMPTSVRTFLSPFKRVPYNTRDIQDLTSDHCGLFCVSCDYFFRYKANPKLSPIDNYDNFLNAWSPYTKENDKLLKHYFD